MKHEALNQYTIDTLREILTNHGATLDETAEQRLQWICQEKLYALSDLKGETAKIKASVRAFEQLSSQTRQKIAERIEAYYTDHLRREIAVLTKWVEDLQGTPIDQKKLKGRLGFGGHFNPDIRFKGRLEEKFIHSFSGIEKILFGDGKKPLKAETYILEVLIRELCIFFSEELCSDLDGSGFSEFVKNLITDPAMEDLDVPNIQKVIERAKRSGGNLIPE